MPFALTDTRPVTITTGTQFTMVNFLLPGLETGSEPTVFPSISTVSLAALTLRIFTASEGSGKITDLQTRYITPRYFPLRVQRARLTRRKLVLRLAHLLGRARSLSPLARAQLLP